MKNEATSETEAAEVWVCVDCYFAHHYGVTETRTPYPVNPDAPEEGLDVLVEWFAGESDTPADREPLARLEGAELADNTDSETGEGIDEFSMSSCEGCGSHLGGSRYRLAAWS